MNTLIVIQIILISLIIYLLIWNTDFIFKYFNKYFKWLKVRKYVKIKLIKYMQLKDEQEKIIDNHVDDLQKKEFEMILKANNINIANFEKEGL